MSNQAGFKNAKQFLFVIDPLSIKDFKQEVDGNRGVSNSAGCVKSMDDTLNTLIDTLESYTIKRGKYMFNCDIAVVINKCDVAEVDREVRQRTVLQAMSDDNLALKTELDALNYVCEKFLKKYNEINFLQQLKSRFAMVQFQWC